MPDLRAERAAAVRADDLAAQRVLPAVAVAHRFSPFELGLHGFPFFGINDRFVAVLDQVLRHLALVRFLFLGKEVNSERLLQPGCAAVFLVRQDAVDRCLLPSRFPARRGNAFVSQLFRDRVGGLSLHEQTVDPAHQRGLRFVHDRRVAFLRAFFIPEEPCVSKTDLAVRELFALSPCHVFRDRP